jgi:hypothetical protein
MAGMGAESASGPWDLLLQYGPVILIISVAAMTLALAARRPISAIPAVLAGALLYWGMYGQANLPAVYAAIAIGLVVWTGLFFWVRGLSRRSAPRSSA